MRETVLKSMMLTEPAECAICLFVFNPPCKIAVLCCHQKHFFHEDCINGVIKFAEESAIPATCPLCRVEIDRNFTTKYYKGIEAK